MLYKCHLRNIVLFNEASRLLNFPLLAQVRPRSFNSTTTSKCFLHNGTNTYTYSLRSHVYLSVWMLI
jgi:hypothetical protein